MNTTAHLNNVVTMPARAVRDDSFSHIDGAICAVVWGCAFVIGVLSSWLVAHWVAVIVRHVYQHF